MMYGTTAEEVEGLTNIGRSTVSARRSDLRFNGYTDYLRDENGNILQRPTKSGGFGKVQIAIAKGIRAINDNAPLMFKGGDPTAGKHGGDSASQHAFSHTDRYGAARRVLACMVQHTPKNLPPEKTDKVEKERPPFTQFTP